MNKEQKAAVVEELAGQIQEARAIFAVDYRGISVPQAAELRTRLDEAGARFRVVKNTLTERAADKADAESLKELLDGPTAFTFVSGDAALAAKAIATFRREHGLLEWKGGQMEGETLTVDEIESIARLPARDVLHGQFVGVLASPITGLVRGLASMISGIAIQLKQIEDQGLIGGEAVDGGGGEAAEGGEAPAGEAAADDGAEAPAAEEPEASAEEPEAPTEDAEEAAEEGRAEEAESEAGEDAAEEGPAEEATPAEEAQAEDATPAEEAPAEDATPAEEAPGDAVAAAETAEEENPQEETSDDTPSEGDEKEG